VTMAVAVTFVIAHMPLNVMVGVGVGGVGVGNV